MKLGEVIKNERERRGKPAQELADAVGMSADEYAQVEAGDSELEVWGPRLWSLGGVFWVAMKYMVSTWGRSDEHEPGMCGRLIREKREEQGLSPEHVAHELGIDAQEYRAIEEGSSLMEEWAPRMVRWAEVLDMLVVNFVMPFGLPFEELDEYPQPPERKEEDTARP